MKLIKLIKKTNHKTEQIELIISIICMVNCIKLSETEIRVLAYYVVHGLKDTTDKLIINSKVITSRSLDNIKTKLLRLGFLKRTKELYKSYELNLSKDYTDNNILNLFITIDNS